MIIRNRISLFVVTFLIIGFFFLALPEKGFSGAGFSLGCCRTLDVPPEQDGGECVACGEDISCFTSPSFCSSEMGFFIEDRVCLEESDGALCPRATGSAEGCCVTEQGICVDQTIEDCNNNIAGAEIWLGLTSCSEVPQCAPLSGGCVPNTCVTDGTCDCFNEQNKLRGCLEEVCHDQGPVCSCAWISNNGNPLGKHIRLTDCLPGPIFHGEGPQQVYADCDERKEIPIVTQEIECIRFCSSSNENPPK